MRDPPPAQVHAHLRAVLAELVLQPVVRHEGIRAPVDVDDAPGENAPRRGGVIVLPRGTVAEGLAHQAGRPEHVGDARASHPGAAGVLGPGPAGRPGLELGVELAGAGGAPRRAGLLLGALVACRR